jgi:cytochrome c biogenesis protein CcmG, thiol:disulfide interchange protein DsbE
MALSRQPGFKLYGIAYKDKPADTRQFLSETGDPFTAIVSDAKGARAIDWGVSAAPETFVVDRHGIIRFKYVGGLSETVVASQLMPAIKAAQGN